MRSIVIVTENVAHTAPMSLKALLEELGHSATIVDESNVTATSLDSYDNILAVRTSDNAFDLGNYLRGYISRGKWVGCGSFTGTAGAASESSVTAVIGMGVETIRNQDESLEQVVTTSHPLLGNRAVGSAIQWLAQDDFSNTIPFRNDGVRLTQLAAYPQTSSIHLFTPQDLSIETETPGGCGIYLGCLYTRNGYGVDAPEIMNNLLESKPAIMKGVATGRDGQPVTTTVRAYHRASGALGAQAVSSESDGTFILPVWSQEEHYVVALGQEDENSLIHDFIMPAPI